MKRLNHKLELIANVSIILLALVIGGVLIKKSVFPGDLRNTDQAELRAGDRIEAIDENWQGNRKMLILALQAGCRFCSESAPFYKRLLETIEREQVAVIAVFPTEVDESTRYLERLGVTGIEVRRLPLNSLRVRGTPTLILADSNGKVTDIWVGKLSADQEANVMSKLTF